MSSPRLWLLVTLLATLTWPLSLPAQSQSFDPSRPAAGRDVVVVANDSELNQGPASLLPDPLFGESWVVDFVRTQTAKRDSNWKAFPEGVEALPSVQDGTWKVDGERMTLRYQIRPRRWHDGRPVTCGDFVFRHRVFSDERVVDFVAPATRRVAHVTCPRGETGHEMIVTWRERHAWANLRPPWPLPRHLLERYYRANPARLRDAPFGQDAATTVGDGPYRLVEFRRNVSFTVEAVPDHQIFGTPKIRRIVWRRFAPEEILPLLRSGEVDIGILNGPPSLSQVEELAALPRDLFQVLFVSGTVWEHLDFNLGNPLLQDRRVRQAIAHGVNRTLIVQQLFKGKVAPSHTLFGPKHPGYTDAVQRYPYDPSRARALLQQAGFAPGPDGVMRNAAGQRLTVEISTTSDGAPERDLVELLIQQQLRLVGIEVTIVNFPFRQFFGLVVQRRQFKGLALYNWVLFPTSTCVHYLSREIPTETNGWEGTNYPGYVNLEIDRLCTAVLQEIDEVQRTSMLRRAAQILARDLPALPLYFRPVAVAAKAGLENFKLGYPCAVGCFVTATWNSHQWAWR